MNKKIHKLSVKPDFEFFLIGIASHENDYRLSWALNKNFGFNFAKVASLKVIDNKTLSDRDFNVFTFEDEDTLLRYHLISNRCVDGFLIDELKNIDYWLQIFGEVDGSFLKQFISSLKKIDIVSTAFEIDPHSLKSKNKLIF